MVGAKQLLGTNRSQGTETDCAVLRFVCPVLIPAGSVVKIFSLHDCNCVGFNDPDQSHCILSSFECQMAVSFLLSTFSVPIRIPSVFILGLFITSAFLQACYAKYQKLLPLPSRQKFCPCVIYSVFTFLTQSTEQIQTICNLSPFSDIICVPYQSSPMCFRQLASPVSVCKGDTEAGASESYR